MTTNTARQQSKRQRSLAFNRKITSTPAPATPTNNGDLFFNVNGSGEAVYDTSPTGKNNDNGGEDVEMQDDATVVAGSTPIEVLKHGQP